MKTDVRFWETDDRLSKAVGTVHCFARYQRTTLYVMMYRCLPVLPALCWLAWAAAQPPPSSEEQAKLLEEIRAGSLTYTGKLPDFICAEQTHRYTNETGREAWRVVDSLTSQLSYFSQKESFQQYRKYSADAVIRFDEAQPE